MDRAGIVLRVFSSALLLALAAVALGVSITHGHYDPQQNRAPAARIVLAAVALIPALVALRFAFSAVDDVHRRRRTAAEAGMAFLSLFFLLAWLIIDLSTGKT